MKKRILFLIFIVILSHSTFAADVSQNPINNTIPINVTKADGTDLINKLNASDDNIQAVTNTWFNATWNFSGTYNYAYLILEAKEAFPSTFYIQKWNGSVWENITSCGYSTSNDDIRLFDISGELPDANGEYTLRIEHISAEVDGSVDYIGLNVSNTPLNPNCGAQLATDYTLSENLTCTTSNGLYLANSNVELNCDNHWIIGPGPTNGLYGVVSGYISGSGAQQVTVKNCNVKHFDRGVNLIGSHNTITDNVFENNYAEGDGCTGMSGGICSDSAVNATVTGNTISGRCYGMYLQSSTASSIQNNTIQDIEQSNRGYGIYLESGSNNNKILNNYIQRCGSRGIYLDSSNNNNVSENKLYNNSDYGLYLSSSTGTQIWHNSIYDNDGGGSGKEVYSSAAIELSYNDEGNYWGHTSCLYYNSSRDANNNNVLDSFPYNQDNFGSTWGTPPIYDCVATTEPDTLPVIGGVATPTGTNTSASYITNITGLNGSEVNISVSTSGASLTGTVFFYLNISGQVNGTATIYFKIHNSTINNIGGSTNRIFVYANHGSGFGTAEQLNFLDYSGNYAIFEYNTTEFSTFTPTYVPVQNNDPPSSNGGSGNKKTFTITIISKGVEQLLRLGDKIQFAQDSETHTLELKEAKSHKIKVIIRSDPIELEINISETVEVDLNNDSINDISLSYLSYGSKIKLKVSKLEEKQDTSTLPPPSNQTETDNNETKQDINEDIQDKNIDTIQEINSEEETSITSDNQNKDIVTIEQSNQTNTFLVISAIILFLVITLYKIKKPKHK